MIICERSTHRVLRCATVLMLVAAGSLLTGCATVTRGTTEQLRVESVPTGATVRLSNGFTGTTPAIFKIPRKGDLIVTVSMAGYETSNVTVTTGLSGGGTAGLLGNALIGGLVGGGIDVATGAALSHKPNPVTVNLLRIEVAAPPMVSNKPEPPLAGPQEP
jgi:hypothetical protein